jgi:hypothetical protein
VCVCGIFKKTQEFHIPVFPLVPGRAPIVVGPHNMKWHGLGFGGQHHDLFFQATQEVEPLSVAVAGWMLDFQPCLRSLLRNTFISFLAFSLCS